MSCEQLAQISLMERKELDTDFTSVCWISHHFFYFLALSTQNIFFIRGMYLFLHVFKNSSTPFQFPLIPKHLVSWGKHPLTLQPSFSSNSCRKSNPSFCYCSHCRGSCLWVFEKRTKKKKKKENCLDRIITENHKKKKKSSILTWHVAFQKSQLFHFKEYF